MTYSSLSAFRQVRPRNFYRSPENQQLPLLQRLYAARGADPSLTQYALNALARTDEFSGIQVAAEILSEAITERLRILIVGDYDVDGATSTALCVLAIRAMGGQVDYFVPDRFVHGYGLSPSVVESVIDRQPDLLMTVDNGIASLDGVALARTHGMRVVITDHHLAGARLPEADAIVNPNQPGCSFRWKSTAGVGVAFYVLAAVRQALKAKGWFSAQRTEPNLAAWLDLVALGTVADVVPLEFNNRVLVSAGIKRIRSGHCRPGITALLSVSGRVQARLVASDLAFSVGPRLNAAGRLQDIGVGVECLLTEDSAQALRLAGQLDELNKARREIESDMRDHALQIVSALVRKQESCPVAFCLYDPDWHEGVLGIVASRVKEAYHRPVITLSRSESGDLKGSGRSIPGLHLRDALDEVATLNPGLISRFGGHAMAAGLTLPPENLEAFRHRFIEVVASRLGPEALESVLETDGELAAEELILPTAQEISEGGPWGQGFPEPLFQGSFELVSHRIVGEKHLKFRVRDPRSGRELEAIAFNADVRKAYAIGEMLHLVYRLDVNEYRGVTTLQLLIEYISKSAF